MSDSLHLYEQILLLALRDEKGTDASGFGAQLVAGAVLAELLLDERISVEKTRKKLVDLRDRKPVGDPVIDACLAKMAAAKRRASLQTWVSRLAGIKELMHIAARRLCDRGVLRADESTVLFLFTRRTYPEINPGPERAILDELREAIFTDRAEIDPRTVVLVSLARGADLLKQAFGRKAIKSRRKRIEQIVDGELTGQATRQVIEAAQAAVLVAAVLPAMMVTTVQS